MFACFTLIRKLFPHYVHLLYVCRQGIFSVNTLKFSLLWLVFGISLTVGLLGVSSLPALAETKQEKVERLKHKQEVLASKKQSIHWKRKELYKKAKYYENRWLQKQQELGKTERQLSFQESVRQRTQLSVGGLGQQLDKTLTETTKLTARAGRRIRSMYMGQQVGLIDLLLNAENFAAFLDRKYYMQKIAQQDKALLSQLRDKTVQLNQQKRRLDLELLHQRQAIAEINGLRSVLSSQAREEASLRSKYLSDARYYARLENELLRESARVTSNIRALLARPQYKTPIKQSTGRFIWPMRGPLTSHFGYRYHPIHRYRARHTGIDISRPTGTPIVAADGGRVIAAGWQQGYGKAVVILHGRGLATLYGHMSRISVSVGQSVSQGQHIGACGSTGYSTGSHLHFEVRVGGSPVNPLGYL
jgi:murein DD-endopeptidase MepM/ murein hydrolase activator NlpD